MTQGSSPLRALFVFLFSTQVVMGVLKVGHAATKLQLGRGVRADAGQVFEADKVTLQLERGSFHIPV